MSVLPRSLFEALEADASLWPGALAERDRGRLEAVLAPLPAEVRDVLVGAVIDPERNDWGRAAVHGIAFAVEAGARVTGMATDELVELVDRRGDRFVLDPIGFRLPEHPAGDPRDLDRLLAGLDGVFAHRRYVLYLRRPVPRKLDVQPIVRAVALWLAAIDRGERAETHAVYEDDDVAIDLTLVDRPDAPRPADAAGGRVLTIRPAPSLERLGNVDARIVEAAARSEESLGDVPLVLALDADRRWGISRGYVQQLLYGTPDSIRAARDGAKPRYEATFTPNGRSLFSDPACRTVAALWWLEPAPGGDPLVPASRVYDNPWARRAPSLRPAGERFAAVGEPGRKGVVTVRWEGR